MKTKPLYQVAALGHFQTKLGRRCFPLAMAVEMARDLRNRGYFDAHPQLWSEGCSRPPFALTLCVRGGRRK